MDDFWRRIEIRGLDDCWNWSKGKSDKGYGRYTKAKRNGMPSGSHQVAWILTNGSIPLGLYVCHSCDNPSCCNPKHLFLGTAKDNAQDKVKKGRQPKGEQIPSHKLTEDQVRSILKSNDSAITLSQYYNVSVVLIHLIKKHKSWSHLHA